MATLTNESDVTQPLSKSNLQISRTSHKSALRDSKQSKLSISKLSSEKKEEIAQPIAPIAKLENNYTTKTPEPPTENDITIQTKIDKRKANRA